METALEHYYISRTILQLRFANHFTFSENSIEILRLKPAGDDTPVRPLDNRRDGLGNSSGP